MICYKDMSFCNRKDCYYFNNGCKRTLTDKVIKDAEKFGLPICTTIFEDCFISKEAHERAEQTMKLKDVK